MRREELLRLLDGVLVKEPSAPPDAATAIPSAVLVIIHYRRGRPHVLLTRRSQSLNAHRGEISFPGGRHARGDATLLDTALRETEEEVGIKIPPQEVIGSLQPVRTMTSNHFIVPFVTVQDSLPAHRVSEEVAEVLDLPLMETLATKAPDTEHFHLAKNAFRFTHGRNVIWGATARILGQLHDALIG